MITNDRLSELIRELAQSVLAAKQQGIDPRRDEDLCAALLELQRIRRAAKIYQPRLEGTNDPQTL